MLWLDTSLSPPILKRYTGSAWIAVGAQELKTSGITIGETTSPSPRKTFCSSSLTPANNENVLMEMSANGNVGFRELYADEIISDSVAKAYAGPTTLIVNPSYNGTSTTYFRSLSEAVKAVNGKYLTQNVNIYLPSSGTDVYDPSGVLIQGVTGPGRLMIYGYSTCRLNSYIKGLWLFSTHLLSKCVSERVSRSLRQQSQSLSAGMCDQHVCGAYGLYAGRQRNDL